MDKWYNFYWNIVDDNSFGVVGKSFNRFVRKFVKKHLDNTMYSLYKNNPIENGLNRADGRSRKLVC